MTGRDASNIDATTLKMIWVVVGHRCLKMNQGSSVCEILLEVTEGNVCVKLQEGLECLHEIFHSNLHDVLIVSLFVIIWHFEYWRPNKAEAVMNIFGDLNIVVDKDNTFRNNISAGEETRCSTAWAT